MRVELRETLSYRHAWTLALAVLAAGVGLHLATGPVPRSLVSLSLLWAPALGAAFWSAIKPESASARFLGGAPLAVASTTIALVLVLPGAIWPTDAFSRFGVASVWESWPFGLCAVLVATNLAASCARRARPLTWRNATYLASHAGLLVVLAGGGLSSVLLDRRQMVLTEGVPNNLARAADGSVQMLPFEATLREFQLETFPPTLVLAKYDPETKTAQATPVGGFVEQGMRATVEGVSLEVLEFVPKAVAVEGEWRAMPWKSAAPAARIRATRGEQTLEGWVSCGGLESAQAGLELDDTTAILMPPPNARRYRSTVDIRHGDQVEQVAIEVNRPVPVAGLLLYQLSYDETMGAASLTSVLEVVEDRAVPIVYVGIALTLLGVIGQLVLGTRWESR